MKLLTVSDIFDCTFTITVPMARTAGREEFEHRLRLLVGGYTVQHATGTWHDVNEDVEVYIVHCHRSQAGPVQDAIEDFVRALLNAGEQAVLATKDGKGMIYAYAPPFPQPAN